MDVHHAALHVPPRPHFAWSDYVRVHHSSSAPSRPPCIAHDVGFTGRAPCADALDCMLVFASSRDTASTSRFRCNRREHSTQRWKLLLGTLTSLNPHSRMHTVLAAPEAEGFRPSEGEGATHLGAEAASVDSEQRAVPRCMRHVRHVSSSHEHKRSPASTSHRQRASAARIAELDERPQAAACCP